MNLNHTFVNHGHIYVIIFVPTDKIVYVGMTTRDDKNYLEPCAKNFIEEIYNYGKN